MHWLELHIDTTHDGLDPVTALLSSLGIDNAVSYTHLDVYKRQVPSS